MIEIFRWDGRWRIRVTDETFEFDKREEMNAELERLLKLKEDAEPYKR